MSFFIPPGLRVAQPQGLAEIDLRRSLAGGLGFHVCNSSGRDVVGNRFVTKSASLGVGVTGLGQGLSSAANAAFSAPLDLSGTSEITVAFILRRNTATGVQVLVEHTINQNNQAGSFLIYTDTTNFLASVSNGLGGAENFNVASCAAPAVGRTTRVVVTLARRGTSARACRIWYDGVEQVTTQPNTGSISGAFANSTTYFFGRAAASLFANAVIHDLSIWRRLLLDHEVGEWSDNPWQLYRPIQRPFFFDMGAGGGNNGTANGVTFTPAASIIPGVATGQQNGTATGQTLSVAASLIPGSASAAGGGTASGVTLPVAASLLPGAAAGVINGSAPGATMTVGAGLIPGAASSSGTATGKTLAVAASIVPGTASAGGSAVAPGATLQVGASLIPGSASAVRNATAFGAFLELITTFVPGQALTLSSEPSLYVAYVLADNLVARVPAGAFTAYVPADDAACDVPPGDYTATV